MITASGLVLIVLTVGQDLTPLGFGLAMGSAISWGVGNILLKGLGDVEMLHLVVWLSLVLPLPALALALMVDGPAALAYDFSIASSNALLSALYLGVGHIFAYAVWGRLLRRYPAATVTPFALLVPFVGGYSSALVFGEQFGPLRLAGMALGTPRYRRHRAAVDRLAVRGRSRGREAAAPLAVEPAGRADAPGVVELIGRVFFSTTHTTIRSGIRLRLRARGSRSPTRFASRSTMRRRAARSTSCATAE